MYSLKFRVRVMLP